MSTIDPSNPIGASQPPPSQGTGPAPYSASGSGSDDAWSAFKNFLGPKDFEIFKKNLCQAISTQIGNDQKKAQKANEQLKKSETGQNMYD